MSARAERFSEAARRYSELGWALIPVDGKKPRGAAWQTTQPDRDLEHVAGVWSVWGQRWNMGAVLGPSGVAVVEFDSTAGGDKLLELIGGELPTTPIVQARRGLHLYFGAPAQADKVARDGLELRAGGHMCVLPPSEHPETGGAYRWMHGLEPWSVPLADIPQPIVDYFKTTSNGNRGSVLGEMIPEGGRNETLASFAGTMRRRGASTAAILAALRVENAERCVPPLPDEELERIAASIARYPATHTPVVFEARSSVIEDTEVAVRRLSARPADSTRLVREKSEIGEERFPSLGVAALKGFVGDAVRAIAPFTEADLAAVLVQLLVLFGNTVGRKPHAMAGAERHAANLNALVVGQSAKSRKGSSLTPPLRLLEIADPVWSENRVKSGLSSGEGLVHQVRDGVDDGDEGVPDKRLLVVEGEFARVLTMKNRDGNILSTTMRDAWDGRPLGSLTKSTPTRAARHHISIVAHITEEELRRELTATDAANGFGNRFLFIATRRRQLLPNPPLFEGAAVETLAKQLAERIKWASTVGGMLRTREAEELWDTVYRGELARDWKGLRGALTARSEAQTLRLSIVFALVNGSKHIRPEDIEAALEVWRYNVASVTRVFGDALGDTIADRIRTALRESERLSRSEVSELFKRHADFGRLQQALNLLEGLGLARTWREPTSGRPVEWWASCEQ